LIAIISNLSVIDFLNQRDPNSQCLISLISKKIVGRFDQMRNKFDNEIPITNRFDEV
jgi:hypothetical protein